MLHIYDFSDASTVYNKHNITKVIIPLAVDTMADCKLYKTIAQKYPDLDEKFKNALGNRVCKPGEYIRLQLDNGHVVFFIIIRVIEKYQPYLLDITNALDKVLTVIRREVTADNFMSNGILFPLPASDELKLSDNILIPALCDKLNVKDLTTVILTYSDCDKFIEKIDDGVVYYKRDSWQADWMLTLDDILLLDVIYQLNSLMHDFKISKTNLIRCYRICNMHGMFPKLEFYDTPFGPFFKMFLPKSNSLINHGLLMNVHHFSNAEPKKFSCIFGPMFPYLMNAAYTQILNNRDKTSKIANEVRQDYIKSFQNKPDTDHQKPFQKPTYQKRDTGDADTFSF